ncbi:MAG: periplasmic heavy metal sensor [Rhodospirillales bacterium]|nr:periplasmic heavy metal sensor [Alphaproteobacteria bacterium]MCB1840142.1 periplasmic heavy metal sensor [Alphaproteobacteria bacterium]MCB9977895.1 periplasmic heavy metal sensor [Rhodospirillales bacterium]
MSKKMKILFTLSVLVNLLLAGLIIGHSAKRWHHGWPPQPYTESLSGGSADLIRQAFNDERKGFLPLIEEMRGVKAEMMAAVSGEQFDEEAFDSATLKMKDTMEKMTTQRFALLKSLAGQLPKDDRVKFTDKFVRFIQGYGKIMYKSSGPRPPFPPPHGDHPWKDMVHGTMPGPSSYPSGSEQPSGPAGSLQDHSETGVEKTDDFGYLVFPNGDIDLDGDMIPDYSFDEEPPEPSQK